MSWVGNGRLTPEFALLQSGPAVSPPQRQDALQLRQLPQGHVATEQCHSALPAGPLVSTSTLAFISSRVLQMRCHWLLTTTRQSALPTTEKHSSCFPVARRKDAAFTEIQCATAGNLVHSLCTQYRSILEVVFTNILPLATR